MVAVFSSPFWWTFHFGPPKAHGLLTGCHDGLLRVFDLRRLGEPAALVQQMELHLRKCPLGALEPLKNQLVVWLYIIKYMINGSIFKWYRYKYYPIKKILYLVGTIKHILI